MQEETKDFIGNIIDFLCKDRGSTNTKKIFNKITDKHVEKIGFAILMAFIIMLFGEQVLRMFFDESIMEQGFYIIGAVADVFAIFYIARIILVGEKQKLKEFIKTHIWDILLFIMLPIAFISALRGEVREYAFWGVMFRHDGFISYLIYASLYICAKSIKSNKLRRILLRAMAMLICSLSINTFLQFNFEIIEGNSVLVENICQYGVYNSIYYNTNHFAYILIMGLMASGILVVIEEKKLLKVIWLFVYGFVLWGLIVNNTFGGYLAVALGTVFMSIVMFVNNKKNLIASMAVLLVFVGVSIFTDIHSDGILRKNIKVTYSDAKTMDTNNAGGSGRIGLWKENIEFIKQKPWLGYGPEGTYMMMIRGETIGDRPHNEYIQHALYMGIPAGIAYIAALITLFIAMIKRLKYLPKELIAMGVIVFTYCVSAFFGNTLYNTVPYFFMFLGGISVCGMIKKEDEKTLVNEE